MTDAENSTDRDLEPIRRVPISMTRAAWEAVGARVGDAEELTFGRHPPYLVRSEAIDQFPVKAAPLVILPNNAPDMA